MWANPASRMWKAHTALPEQAVGCCSWLSEEQGWEMEMAGGPSPRWHFSPCWSNWVLKENYWTSLHLSATWTPAGKQIEPDKCCLMTHLSAACLFPPSILLSAAAHQTLLPVSLLCCFFILLSLLLLCLRNVMHGNLNVVVLCLLPVVIKLWVWLFSQVGFMA